MHRLSRFLKFRKFLKSTDNGLVKAKNFTGTTERPTSNLSAKKVCYLIFQKIPFKNTIFEEIAESKLIEKCKSKVLIL